MLQQKSHRKRRSLLDVNEDGIAINTFGLEGQVAYRAKQGGAKGRGGGKLRRKGDDMDYEGSDGWDDWMRSDGEDGGGAQSDDSAFAPPVTAAKPTTTKKRRGRKPKSTEPKVPRRRGRVSRTVIRSRLRPIWRSLEDGHGWDGLQKERDARTAKGGRKSSTAKAQAEAVELSAQNTKFKRDPDTGRPLVPWVNPATHIKADPAEPPAPKATVETPHARPDVNVTNATLESLEKLCAELPAVTRGGLRLKCGLSLDAPLKVVASYQIDGPKIRAINAGGRKGPARGETAIVIEEVLSGEVTEKHGEAAVEAAKQTKRRPTSKAEGDEGGEASRGASVPKAEPAASPPTQGTEKVGDKRKASVSPSPSHADEGTSAKRPKLEPEAEGSKGE
jgi:hypothetical protein